VRQRLVYQDQAFWANKKLRRYMLMWLRQGRKTSTLAEQSLLEMAEHEGRLITFATASLNLGSEMPEKEAQVWQLFLRDMRAWAEERKLQLVAGERRHEHDADSWRQLPDDIDIGGLADVLVHSKFEVRLKHSNTVSSRLKVIAANVQTARGFSGSVKLDECAFVDDLRTLLAELEPIFSTDPTFNFLMATTPPPDYAHYAYELLTPEDGKEDFEPCAEGNWFKNRAGIWVHRVTIDDAALAGRKNYHPDSGEEITPDEAREASPDKEGWDRSNRLKRPLVGTSAVSPLALDTAQRKGLGRAAASHWPEELAGIPAGALEFVKGTVGLGVDLATTTNKKSNPTGLSIVSQEGDGIVVPTILWWKTANPHTTTGRVVGIIKALLAMGVKVQGVGVDATSEKYYAILLKEAVGALCEVQLIVSSESIETPEGKISLKSFLGADLANAIESGKAVLPFNTYVYKDFMRVVKNLGSYDAAVGPNGEHGDTFDSTKLGMRVLKRGGSVEAWDMQRGEGDGGSNGRSPHPSWMERGLDLAARIIYG
jgi:hypothetical protein